MGGWETKLHKHVLYQYRHGAAKEASFFPCFFVLDNGAAYSLAFDVNWPRAIRNQKFAIRSKPASQAPLARGSLRI